MESNPYEAGAAPVAPDRTSNPIAKLRKLALVLSIVAGLVVALAYFAYPVFEANYQRNMDPIRKRDAHEIADVIREFADRTGHLPFQEHASQKPFMVVIGHSPEEEDRFANDPVLKRGATWANAKELEALLSKGLRRQILLPRDPQKAPTFAPNVYVYFVSGKEMSVVSHLCFPDEMATKYEWNGHPFYAYTIAYLFEPDL